MLTLDIAPAHTVLPTDPEELARCLASPEWRLSNLYWILVKGDDPDDEGTAMLFKPNRAQRRFMSRLWHRNLILKARQLGFTTLICILWLDHALFASNQRCGVVAHDRDSAKIIFRDKVKYAYEHLPPALLAMVPTKEMNADEIVFAHNNSSIRVATSMRSGTLHRLLVSEYGKICAKYPDKAHEVKSGTLPAVPSNGIAVIESTAEGQEGDFHKMAGVSQALYDLGKALGIKDWRFHFYAWWQEPRYRIDPAGVVITTEHDDYFTELETEHHVPVLDPEQKAWYVATMEGDFGGDEQTMWQEYPSYPEEAFKVSTEGTYYARQLQQARKEGRIGRFPHMPGIPVHTFWDIGTNDLNVIWFMQKVGAMHHFINYYENSGEPPSHYVAELQKHAEYVYGTHHIPHDGATRRIQTNSVKSYEQMLRDLHLKNIFVVPVISHKSIGIQMMRNVFPTCCFDEKHTAKGVAALQSYRKQWNTRLSTWGDDPRHDEASNGADGIRQFAQGFKATRGGKPARKTRSNWKTS